MIAQINGVEINCLDAGIRNGKPPIIFIHGFPFSSEVWSKQVELLKNKFRVITYDIRGHGKSGVGDGQYTLELFVDDLVGLLDYLGISKAVLCGLSMGGYIALRTIERNPERVSALVLCDTGPIADTNESKLRRAGIIKSVKAKGAGQFVESFLKAAFAPESFETKQNEVKMVEKIMRSNSEIGICGAQLAMAGRTDTTEALQSIKVPTLILVGEFDTVIPVKISETMHSKIPNSELHILPKAAHLTNLENTEDFDRFLLDFLNRVLG